MVAAEHEVGAGSDGIASVGAAAGGGGGGTSSELGGGGALAAAVRWAARCYSFQMGCMAAMQCNVGAARVWQSISGVTGGCGATWC